MKFLWAILLLIIPTTLMAYENDFSLKFGPSLSLTTFRSLKYVTTPRPGIGFHTHMSYKWVKWELSLSSYVRVAPINKVHLQVRDSEVEGRFYFRSLSFGLLGKYHTSLRPLSPIYPLYVMAGPLVAHQSFKTQNVIISGGRYEKHQKITLESFGFLFGVGIEEEVSRKNYNLFYEIVYQILNDRNAEVVGGTHTKVETLSREKYRGRAYEHSFQFNVGLIVF
jgi:hypothetical protein